MPPLGPPGRGSAGRRALAVVLVATLLASVGPAGGVAVVVGADGGVDSDHSGDAVAVSQPSIGLGVAPAIDLLGQFDPEDEDDRDEEEGDDEEEEDDDEGEEEEDVDDEDDEEGGDDEEEEGEDDEEAGDEVNDDDDRDGADDDEEDEDGDDEAEPPFGEGPPDESGIDDLVETVLTAVAGGPDDDRPGDGGDGPPDGRPESDDEAGDPDESDGNGVDDGGGDAADDVAGESDPSPDEAGSDGPSEPPAPDGSDGAQAPQVEEPTPTESPEPARLRVEDVSANPATVAEGDPVSITATVVNDGEEPGSRDVRLHLFGEVVDVRSVTVPGDDVREVSFDRTIEAPGTYEASVGDASTTITVEATGSTTATDAGPASQETPGFTALAALLGVLATALFVRLRGDGPAR